MDPQRDVAAHWQKFAIDNAVDLPVDLGEMQVQSMAAHLGNNRIVAELAAQHVERKLGNAGRAQRRCRVEAEMAGGHVISIHQRIAPERVVRHGHSRNVPAFMVTIHVELDLEIRRIENDPDRSACARRDLAQARSKTERFAVAHHASMQTHRELVDEGSAIGAADIAVDDRALRQNFRHLPDIERQFQRARKKVHRPRRNDPKRHAGFPGNARGCRNRTVAATRHDCVEIVAPAGLFQGLLHLGARDGRDLDLVTRIAKDRLNPVAIGRHVRRSEGPTIPIEDSFDFHERLTGSIAVAHGRPLR
ncbi:hypothetical protein BKP54_33425 [Ensifer sp. 1H6]|nr:hypothetical protein BKP54_33425 [Ensifer sp. 1H6]